MSYLEFVNQYRDWSIEGHWNKAKQRWDCVATKGEERIESGEMNWYQFNVALDRADGRPILEDFLETLLPEKKEFPWSTWVAPEGEVKAPKAVAEPTIIESRPFVVGIAQGLFGDEVFA